MRLNHMLDKSNSHLFFWIVGWHKTWLHNNSISSKIVTLYLSLIVLSTLSPLFLPLIQQTSHTLIFCRLRNNFNRSFKLGKDYPFLTNPRPKLKPYTQIFCLLQVCSRWWWFWKTQKWLKTCKNCVYDFQGNFFGYWFNSKSEYLQ